MICNYLANGSINCIENFSKNEIDDFDNKNFRLYSTNANLTGLIIDNELFSNSNLDFKVRAYIDDELRSKSLESKDIIKIPNHKLFKEFKGKNVFLLTIYGNKTSVSDEGKNINFKIEVGDDIYDLVSVDNTVFKYISNSRFDSSIKEPLEFKVVNSNNGIALPSDKNKILEDNIDNINEVSDKSNTNSDEIDNSQIENNDSSEKKIDASDSNNILEVSDDIKGCLNTFLDCNKTSSSTVINRCLNEFISCKTESDFDKCSLDFVNCSDIN